MVFGRGCTLNGVRRLTPPLGGGGLEPVDTVYWTFSTRTDARTDTRTDARTDARAAANSNIVYRLSPIVFPHPQSPLNHPPHPPVCLKTSPSPLRTHHDTLVIGAGQAGLAAGYHLQRAGADFLVLDAHARPGDSWRERWDGLQLFSPQRYNGLPGYAPPGGEWHLPSRIELADYLSAYAEHHALPLLPHCTCDRAEKWDDGMWHLWTTQGQLTCRRLLVATGAYRDKRIPTALSEQFPPGIEQVHSSEVTAIEPVPEVLVVGAGASGQQLARLYAAAGSAVTLVGSEVKNLPRSFAGKDIYWWLYKTGSMTLKTDSALGKMLIQTKGGTVTVGEPPVPSEIRRIPQRITAYEDESLHFNGRKTPALPWPNEHANARIIWCTGYRNQFPFLADRYVAEGKPLHARGISTVDPTLAFLGLENLIRPNSSLVGGVGRDAGEVIAKLLASD